MIKRDNNGIIVQHCEGYPDYADGGDSAARTGIMALCGSKIDQNNLELFVIGNTLVRHPYQREWSDTKKTSRDQLIQWAAGLNTIENKHIVNTLVIGWFINKDFLPTDVQLYLCKAMGKTPSRLIKLLGYPMMFISLLWACFIAPKAEQNKMFCMMAVMGWMKLYNRLHYDLAGNIKEYWSGKPFRDQAEIAEAIISKINSSL